jgi:glycosyltransferase involved in cell wall biosynthesis
MATVSVLLPVRNGERYLHESITSILSQSYPVKEICIIDDGSIDSTGEIIAGFNDNRIKTLHNSVGMGVAYSLNRGIRETASDYIIRIDADDINYPDRIALQVEFMEKNPLVGISGSWIKHIGRYQGVVERKPVGSDTVKSFLLFDNPLVHPSCILRRASLQNYSLWYDSEFTRSEDYDLWERASYFFKLDNIPEPLIKFRVHCESVTHKHGKNMWRQTCDIQNRNLTKLGFFLTEKEKNFHRAISHGELVKKTLDLQHAAAWFQKLLEANAQKKIYPQNALQEAIGFVWFRLCRNNSLHGFEAWKIFKSSKYSHWISVSRSELRSFVIAIIYHFFRHKMKATGRHIRRNSK